MIKPQDIPLYQQTPIWLGPALWCQLARLHEWLQRCATRLGEPVDAQYCAIKGRIYLIRVSDNLSRAGAKSGWQGTGHKDTAHLTTAPHPRAPAATAFTHLEPSCAARIETCVTKGQSAQLPLRFLVPG